MDVKSEWRNRMKQILFSLMIWTVLNKQKSSDPRMMSDSGRG